MWVLVKTFCVIRTNIKNVDYGTSFSVAIPLNIIGSFGVVIYGNVYIIIKFETYNEVCYKMVVGWRVY